MIVDWIKDVKSETIEGNREMNDNKQRFSYAAFLGIMIVFMAIITLSEAVLLDTLVRDIRDLRHQVSDLVQIVEAHKDAK